MLDAGAPDTPYTTYSFKKSLPLLDWAVIMKEAAIDNMIAQCTYKRTGLTTCPNCKSSNVDYQHVQTRRADEGLTLLVKCNDCNKLIKRS